MNVTKITLANIALLLLFTASFANAGQAGNRYAGVQYANVSYDESGFDTAQPRVLVGRYGAYINDSVALEGRVGFGVADDTITSGSTDITLDFNSLFGVYGVGYLPIAKMGSVYALVGLTTVSLSASASTGGSASDSDSSLSFGAGAQFNINDSVSINAEYTNYINGDAYDVTAISVGLNVGF